MLALAASVLLSSALIAVGATAQAGTGATLTVSAASVENGASFTFTYSVPAASVSPFDVVAIGDAGQLPVPSSVVAFKSAPGATGTVTFNAGALNGTGSYSAFLANESSSALLAGPVDFEVTRGSLAPAPSFARSIGQHMLAGPSSVAMGASGAVWVADTGHNRIAEFSPSGRPLASTARGSLDEPEGIAVAASGNIWVADTGSNEVVEFGSHGRRISAFGSAGSGLGELNQPVALAISGTTVYVADQGNSRIDEFTATGGYLASISVPTPAGVALDGTGDIWVSSPSASFGNTVFEFSATGKPLLSFGNTQAGYGALGESGGIAVGRNGLIYVTQPDYGFVTVFTASGGLSTEFGLQSDTRLASENMRNPQALAIAASGEIYVADSGTNRIVAYTPAASRARVAAPIPPAPGGTAVPVIIVLALLALALLALALAGGIIWLRAARRRAAPRPAATAPVMCTMPDSATAEPFASVQARLKSSVLADISRRRLLVSATALSGVAAAGVLPMSLRRQLTASLNNPVPGDLRSIEHIVILMQENRSFDHYFGTFPGVRGFADPTAITLSTGNPVFSQPDASHAQGYLTPFHYDTKSTSAQATPGTDHSWTTQHEAWNNGQMDQWIKAKGEYTMGYFTRHDIPFQWALAEAFTLCDNYHCSVFGPTTPNRLYMWTGMIDPDGTGGGPVIGDVPAFNNVIYSWTTYPERLSAAGITWQVYQEEDNFDDNALAWFKQIANAQPSSDVFRRALTKRPAGWFEADARSGNLPRVSWIVAPTAQSEHPDYFPAAGAEYIASKLDAIASNPDLWSKTLFILTYDENDGMFDHVPPPTAPTGTVDEYVDGAPIGLGFRVPCTLISPWTAGGRIYSAAADHTSLIRIIERVFGVTEPNISAWRRQTCDDLSGALRFGRQAAFPRYNHAISLADAQRSLLTAQNEVFNNPAPLPPGVNEPIPGQ